MRSMISPTWIKLLVGAALIGGVVWVYLSGAHEHLEAEKIRLFLTESGPLGPLVFVALFALLHPIGVSSYLFLIPASVVWSAGVAIGLGWLGAMGSAVVSFVVARFLAWEWVQARIPERLKRYEDRLERDSFRTVLVLRLLFFTSPWIQLACGVSRMRFSAYLLANAIGTFPGLFFAVFLGASAEAWLRNNPLPEGAWLWALIGALGLAGLGGLAYLIRFWMARRVS